jgi:hypothetical protein
MYKEINMSLKPGYIENTADLINSVRRFMEEPTLWRDAVGSSPLYFVHYQDGQNHLFGLSKFCALKNISLADYVQGVRRDFNGGITQKHISKITGQSWIPLDEVNSDIRSAFVAWFSGFFTGSDINALNRISIMDIT